MNMEYNGSTLDIWYVDLALGTKNAICNVQN